MVSVKGVENNTIISFNVLKEDIRTLAKWIVWNKKEHDTLMQRIGVLEAKISASKRVNLVASVKARKVHSSKCLHAKRIKESNKTHFDMIKEAEKLGYSVCDCAA